MTRQRLIQFETTSDDGAERVARTVAAACDAPRPEVIEPVGSYGFRS
jgi:hypothetical protein